MKTLKTTKADKFRKIVFKTMVKDTLKASLQDVF